MLFSGDDGVVEEASHGNRANATRCRGDIGCFGGDFFEIDIPKYFFVIKTYAGIDDDRSRADHVPADDVAFADAGHDDVGGEAFVFDIFGATVASGNAGAFVDEHDGERFADECTHTDDGDVFAGEFDADCFKDTHDGAGGRWQQVVGVHDELAHARVSQEINVAGRFDAVEYFGDVEFFGERELDDEAGRIFISLELFYFLY